MRGFLLAASNSPLADLVGHMSVAIATLCEGATAVGTLVGLRPQVDAYVIDRVAELLKSA